MPILRATTTATLWPRHLLLTDPYRGWQLLERSEETSAILFALVTGQPCNIPESASDFISETGLIEEGEATPAQRIRVLDQLYANATPGLAESIECDAGLSASFNQRLRLRNLTNSAPLSLPSSVGRIGRLLRAQTNDKIYLDEDPNGLGVILSHTHRVTIRASEPEQNLWLSMQAQAEEPSVPPDVVSSLPEVRDHTLSLCYASTPYETFESLERCRQAMRDNGTIALVCRRSYDQWLYDWLIEHTVEVVATHREVDHWLIPEGFCADYPGDLILLRPPPGGFTAPEPSHRDNIKEQPALIIDIERLSQERMTPESLSEFADLLGGLSPNPEESRSVHIGDDLWTLSWQSTCGAALTLQIRPDWLYATICLTPFELGLEKALIHASLLTWADRYTRLDPVRTYWCGKESVFA